MAGVVVVDVGSTGGMQPCWEPYLNRITPVLFEPSSEAAADLRAQMPGAHILDEALSDARSRRTLHIAQCPGCTSLLAPNDGVLGSYSVAPAFRVIRTVDVQCVRYDELHYQGHAPAPDAIKIDVQGFEYEVLKGFGDLLHSCLAVQIEAHFYPIYVDQKTIGDVVALLARFGLVLRKLIPVPHFDGDIVEVDAWFTRKYPDDASLPMVQAEKLALICAAWEIPDRGSRFSPDTWG